ncbi:MAG: triose-phosphate isomerase [Nitrospirae bacterium]|nr:triose-phosphate isomerase [Nitrospirota bacterium]
MRKPFIAANWKMNKTIGETKSFLDEFIPLVKDANDVDIIIAPPFTSLGIASAMLKDTNIQLSAQDIFYEEKGAHR